MVMSPLVCHGWCRSRLVGSILVPVTVGSFLSIHFDWTRFDSHSLFQFNAVFSGRSIALASIFLLVNVVGLMDDRVLFVVESLVRPCIVETLNFQSRSLFANRLFFLSFFQYTLALWLTPTGLSLFSLSMVFG